MNFPALLNTLGTRCRILPIVIFYITEGCNLQCITCSYRKPSPNELSLAEISELARALKEFGLRHIVYSGGEPLIRRDFPEICSLFADHGVRQSLLTNGLLLEKRFGEIGSFFSEIIVSIDGPNEQIHDSIRGVKSFEQIVRGIRHAVESHGRLSIRTVVQKRNFGSIIDMVRFAREVGAKRISFLAADVLPGSFGRGGGGPALNREDVMLSEDETGEFRKVLEQLATECRREFESGFISETPEKLARLAGYYEALLGQRTYPPTVCNAPMVSTVITSTGDLLPCFFLPAYGTIREGSIVEAANSNGVRATRADVRSGRLDRCRTCVCTLHIKPRDALIDRF